MRLPLNRVGALNKISKKFSELEQRYEREPTPAEMAEELEMSITEIAETMRMSGRHLSIDAPFVHGEESRLLDILPNESQPPPDAELIHESLCYEIHQALQALPEREAAVIRYYFGVDGCPQLTLEEIGERLGLTRERVRQIKEKAIRRLRHASRSKELRTYLG